MKMNFDLTATDTRAPLPNFTLETAIEKIRLAEDGWNSQNPEKIATAYSLDSEWRNRDVFLKGRPAIVQFLSDKWAKEQDYRLIKELWAYTETRIAVRYAYEWHNMHGDWFRSYGNENWVFNATGLMTHRHASINDVSITDSDRRFHWPSGRRPDDHPGLTDCGL